MSSLQSLVELSVSFQYLKFDNLKGHLWEFLSVSVPLKEWQEGAPSSQCSKADRTRMPAPGLSDDTDSER